MTEERFAPQVQELKLFAEVLEFLINCSLCPVPPTALEAEVLTVPECPAAAAPYFVPTALAASPAEAEAAEAPQGTTALICRAFIDRQQGTRGMCLFPHHLIQQ